MHIICEFPFGLGCSFPDTSTFLRIFYLVCHMQHINKFYRT